MQKYIRAFSNYIKLNFAERKKFLQKFQRFSHVKISLYSKFFTWRKIQGSNLLELALTSFQDSRITVLPIFLYKLFPTLVGLQIVKSTVAKSEGGQLTLPPSLKLRRLKGGACQNRTGAITVLQTVALPLRQRTVSL